MLGVTRFPPPTPDQPKPRPMSQFKPLPPIQELQQAFAYDPVTGIFTSKRSRGSVKAGDPVGTVNGKGSVQMMLNRRMFLAHRVAWYLMTGNDPMDSLVDHRDRIATHNWFGNLRLATPVQNQGNRLGKGWHRTLRGLYRSQISIGDRIVWLGDYSTPEEAREIYIAKHIEVHGSFSTYFQ